MVNNSWYRNVQIKALRKIVSSVGGVKNWKYVNEHWNMTISFQTSWKENKSLILCPMSKQTKYRPDKMPAYINSIWRVYKNY